MPSTVGLLPQYEVLAALGSNPATLSVVSNRLVSCQITRGRTDELGTMQVGQMTLVLDNGDGAFSPDNPASPYAGYLVPGRKMQIAARFDTATAWNPLFTGYIDSIRPEDNGPLDSNVIIQCVDWLGLMNIKSVTGNVTSGVNVTHWADQSGHARTATAHGSPTQVMSVQNNFPSVRFDGATQYFTLGSSAMGGPNWTVFTVFILANTASNNALYAEALTTGYRFVYESGTTYTTYAYDGTNTSSASDPTTLAANTCYVGTSTSANGIPTTSYINGDVGMSGNATLSAFTPTNFTIGAVTTTATSDFFAGDMLCVIVYNSVLSSTNRTAVRDYLKTLYAAY
jgi:hypothetical protein